MTLVDDRTFIRHFSWVLGGLVGVTIFFIFLAFLIVDLSGVETHGGYTFVAAQARTSAQQAQAAGSTMAAANASAAGATTSSGSAQVAGNSATGGGSGGGGGAAAAAAGGSGKKETASNAAPDGQKIWQAHCAMCHQTGVAGAPKIGDESAWKPILAEADMKTIFHRDINGYTGKLGTMPAKGGNPGLSDDEVIAAAKYMIGKSGGNPGS